MVICLKRNNNFKDENWEISYGNLLSERETVKGQIILGELFYKIKNFFNKKLYEKVFYSNFNVDNKISESQLIINVQNSKNDISKKLQGMLKFYSKYKVKELWLIYSEEKMVETYKLNGNKYGKPKVYHYDDTLNIEPFEEMKIDLKEIFV